MKNDLFNPNLRSTRCCAKPCGNLSRKKSSRKHLEYDRAEQFNVDLFERTASLGLLGLTVPEEDGGIGMDATASVIVHEELSASDPGFCFAYLAHSVLFVNNFAINANAEQKARYLPKVINGEWLAGWG